MLFNTTYHVKDDLLLIDELVGKAFSFFESMKMGGVGSKRFIIEGASQNFKNVLKTFSEINYSNIELRPKGIIVHFTQQLNRYAWAIPYYKLTVYSTETFSIYSDSASLKFKKNKLYASNKDFIKKMLDRKSLYLKKINFYDRSGT